MTITNRIKNEIFNADINYQCALARMKSEYPHGISFCGETVSTRAAEIAMSFYRAEAEFNALVMLVTPKHERSMMEELTRRLIDKYNNAETEEESNAAQSEYYSLYTVRS